MFKKRQNLRKAFLIIMFLIFPVVLNFLSPYLIVVGAMQGIISGSFILFGLLFIVSLFSGRAYCGWLCPVGGLQEICLTMVKDKKVKKAYWLKYVFWAPWFTAIIFFLIHAGGIIKIEPLYMTESGISVDRAGAYFIYFPILFIIVLLAFLVGKRSFCHHVCWMAPFLVLGNRIRSIFKWPAIQLKADKNKCTNCKQCSQKCPMSLDVNLMVQEEKIMHDECILCGECADSCTKNAIRMKFCSGKK